MCERQTVFSHAKGQDKHTKHRNNSKWQRWGRAKSEGLVSFQWGSVTHTHNWISSPLQRLPPTYILCSSVFVAHENLWLPLCVCVCVSEWLYSLQGRHLCPHFNAAVTGPWIMEVFGSDKARLTAKRHFYWVARRDVCAHVWFDLALLLPTFPPCLCWADNDIWTSSNFS